MTKIVISKKITVKNAFKDYTFGGICNGEVIVCAYRLMTKKQLYYIVSNYSNLRKHFVFKHLKRNEKAKNKIKKNTSI